MLCKTSIDRTPQCGVIWSDQARILVEDLLSKPSSFEEKCGVLREVAEPQPRHSGLLRTEQVSVPT